MAMTPRFRNILPVLPSIADIKYMAKHDSTSVFTPADRPRQPTTPLPVWLRRLLSFLILGHVLAIFIRHSPSSTSGMLASEGVACCYRTNVGISIPIATSRF